MNLYVNCDATRNNLKSGNTAEHKIFDNYDVYKEGAATSFEQKILAQNFSANSYFLPQFMSKEINPFLKKYPNRLLQNASKRQKKCSNVTYNV